MAVGTKSLRVPARGPSRPLCHLIGLWVVALLSQVTLFQRGTASDTILDGSSQLKYKLHFSDKDGELLIESRKVNVARSIGKR